jgi:hypothetical protein
MSNLVHTLVSTPVRGFTCIYIYICVYIYTHTYRLGYSWVHCGPQAQDVPIMGASWAQHGPTMGGTWIHHGPMMDPSWAIGPTRPQAGPNMGPTWAHHGGGDARSEEQRLFSGPPPCHSSTPPSPFVDCSCINK